MKACEEMLDHIDIWDALQVVLDFRIGADEGELTVLQKSRNDPILSDSEVLNIREGNAFLIS